MKVAKAMKFAFGIVVSGLIILSGHHVPTAKAQERVKTAVVRIQNTRSREVGAGFIVKIAANKAYIVTASHIVQGNQFPNVFFLNQPHAPVEARVVDIQGDELKGLALLTIAGNSQMFSGLEELKIGPTAQLGHGEPVTFIGFPGATAIWTVDSGNIKRLEGTDLVLSGSIRKGNSGGPVILNQRAIGLVTDVSQSDVYATRAEVIVTYVNGFFSNLIEITSVSAVYTYEVHGWIDSGRARTRQRIDQSTYHKAYFPLAGVELSAFDLTVTQFTNGQACNKGTVKYPVTKDFGWGFPNLSTSSDEGEARDRFEFGVQQARKTPYLEILLNPGRTCTIK